MASRSRTAGDSTRVRVLLVCAFFVHLALCAASVWFATLCVRVGRIPEACVICGCAFVTIIVMGVVCLRGRKASPKGETARRGDDSLLEVEGSLSQGGSLMGYGHVLCREDGLTIMTRRFVEGARERSSEELFVGPVAYDAVEVVQAGSSVVSISAPGIDDLKLTCDRAIAAVALVDFVGGRSRLVAGAA